MSRNAYRDLSRICFTAAYSRKGSPKTTSQSGGMPCFSLSALYLNLLRTLALYTLPTGNWCPSSKVMDVLVMVRTAAALTIYDL